MNFDYSKYLKFLFPGLAVALIAVMAFNFLADPYARLRLVLGKGPSPYAAGLGTRTAKAEMIAHGDWDVLLLGTSRAYRWD